MQSFRSSLQVRPRIALPRSPVEPGCSLLQRVRMQNRLRLLGEAEPRVKPLSQWDATPKLIPDWYRRAITRSRFAGRWSSRFTATPG
jgi:hypothetical protein